ncbi:hypothetical protein FE391_09925 [Nonomuraea sp. KC401]|uniref:hypothetical protein n=1 Tax=unclassified Nonomuraea TaxID=2593643 RepID=UPI0010FE8ABC|nr:MULTISPECIES: hypothetical protein [unclassified Nonomuraea]NBE96748.1 hypothetical protein [Nonomuraea sp. K271]TLF78974.1 hypothetical protein FE391_09925 [Nonomuraea sp. KC401]
MDLDDFEPPAPGFFDLHADVLATLPPVRLAGLRELAAGARRSPGLRRAAEYARSAQDLGYDPDDLPPPDISEEEGKMFTLAADAGFLEVEEGFFATPRGVTWPDVSDAEAAETWAAGMYGVLVGNVTDQIPIEPLDDELLDQDPDGEDALPNFNDAFHDLVPALLVTLLRTPGGVPVSELRRAAAEHTGQISWDTVATHQGDPLASTLEPLAEYGVVVVEDDAVRLTPLGLHGTVFHIREEGHTVGFSNTAG